MTTLLKSNWCDSNSSAAQIEDLTRRYPWLSAAEIGDMLREAVDDDEAAENTLATALKR